MENQENIENQYTSVYFSDKGITITSANFIANKAKENIAYLQNMLSTINLINIELSTLGNENKKIIQKGLTKKDLESIPDIINQIAEHHSLIAWLREAIKAKSELTIKLENTSISDFLKLRGIEINKPTKEYGLYKDDLISSFFNVKERQEYLSAKAHAAVIGEFIHPSGALNKARKQLSNVVNNPTTVNESGANILIYDYVPSVDIQEVEEVNNFLQDENRKLNAFLNSQDHKLEEEYKRLELERELKYNNDLAAYNKLYDEVLKEYNIYIREESKKIQDLKIIIPKELKNIYDSLSLSKGKENDKNK